MIREITVYYLFFQQHVRVNGFENYVPISDKFLSFSFYFFLRNDITDRIDKIYDKIILKEKSIVLTSNSFFFKKRNLFSYFENYINFIKIMTFDYK